MLIVGCLAAFDREENQTYTRSFPKSQRHICEYHLPLTIASRCKALCCRRTRDGIVWPRGGQLLPLVWGDQVRLNMSPYSFVCDIIVDT